MSNIFDLNSRVLTDLRTRYKDDITVLEFVITDASPSLVGDMRLQIRSLEERIRGIEGVLEDKAASEGVS